jgi:uncharacterized Zn finger protein
MTIIACPWCDEDEELSLATLTAPESIVVCASCGTSVLLTEDSAPGLDLAA